MNPNHHATHSFSGATVGYMGISAGVLGIPFINPYMISWLRFRNIPLAPVGAAMYGCLAMGLDVLFH